MKKGFNIESLFTTPSTTVTSTTIPTTKIRHDNHGGRGGKNNGRGRSPDSSHPVDPTSNPRDEDYFYEGGGNSGPELSGENNENEQRGRHNSGYDLNNGKSPSGSADKLPAYVNTKFQHVLFTESPSREKAAPKASEPATTSSPNMSTFTICINYTEGIHIAESKTRGDRDHIGFVVDWINTKQYLDSNQEKLILYLVVSLCIGLILVLLAIIVRLSYVHRKHKRVKLDISEPVANHRLTPSRDLNFDLYSNYDNFDVGLDPGPVRFHGRNTLRGDDEPGERSLNNYYG
ncbi:uncharacterized protein LOC106153196 [Lingula anatina]|uniref:Uncharacterized protein LOC106153196 n=1 Tax=Lingula anatina TaxID=7574 RepID=A0A1S3H8S6_LINAN|nr:uncharacterized protein LOC106153196 [Lingula anatina]|eukprot:XP_013382490.1 uncharacterized protein LOC106153196 [Lingula anatina]